jgi:hypothetical protein
MKQAGIDTKFSGDKQSACPQNLHGNTAEGTPAAALRGELRQSGHR